MSGKNTTRRKGNNSQNLRVGKNVDFLVIARGALVENIHNAFSVECGEWSVELRSQIYASSNCQISSA